MEEIFEIRSCIEILANDIITSDVNMGGEPANQEVKLSLDSRPYRQTANYLVITGCCEIVSPAVFEILCSWGYWGHEFVFSGSRDVIGHVTIWFHIDHFVLVVPCNLAMECLSPAVSEIFSGECNAMVYMTLIRPINKGQEGHSFWHLPIDFSYATSCQ